MITPAQRVKRRLKRRRERRRRHSFWVSWSSSRYDRSLKSLHEAVEHYITKSSLHAGTEVTTEVREDILRDIAREHGWGVVTGDKSYRDDTYIMWEKASWDAKQKGTYRVKTAPMYNANGNLMPDNVCTMVLLEFKETGHRLLVTVLHAPSGVEGKGGLTKNWRRARAWRTEYKAWKKLWNRMAKAWDADAVLTLQDANVNIWRDLFRQMFKAMQPGMRLIPPAKRNRGKGTHRGGRWIDIGFIRGKLRRRTRAILMRDDDSSDHRPWKARLRFVRKPKCAK